MNPELLMVFDAMPVALPLYESAGALIPELFPDAKIKGGKTQVSFSNRYGFASLWPPTRKIKGRPGLYIVLTFGLGRRAEHSRG